MVIRFSVTTVQLIIILACCRAHQYIAVDLQAYLSSACFIELSTSQTEPLSVWSCRQIIMDKFLAYDLSNYLIFTKPGLIAGFFAIITSSLNFSFRVTHV